MGPSWLGYYSNHRKRHIPLKRYKVRACLPDGERVYLVIRARSKKGARQQALENYAVTKAEVIKVIGHSEEEEFFF